MPRGDGTGPLGNGPMRNSRKNCQGMNSGRQGTLNSSITTHATKHISLEEQAMRLEEEAAKLRKLAQQNSTNDNP